LLLELCQTRSPNLFAVIRTLVVSIAIPLASSNIIEAMLATPILGDITSYSPPPALHPPSLYVRITFCDRSGDKKKICGKCPSQQGGHTLPTYIIDTKKGC
jgi:hypothetical protein